MFAVVALVVVVVVVVVSEFGRRIVNAWKTPTL